MMPRIKIPDLAPRDAVDHFREKGCHIGFDHRDTVAAEHKAVDAALAGGWTFRRFRGEIGPLRRRKGWWGRRMMTDPLTGETRPVQPGSARRLGIILDTSLRMAWARGRWQAIRRLAHMRPWLRCVAIPDARTRPGHAGLHGTVPRRDHPAWQTRYPPCGRNCRCTVRQMSDRDPERLGLKPSQAPPEDRSKTRPWHNARTGRTIEVPMGIDPGPRAQCRPPARRCARRGRHSRRRQHTLNGSGPAGSGGFKAREDSHLPRVPERRRNVTGLNAPKTVLKQRFQALSGVRSGEKRKDFCHSALRTTPRKPTPENLSGPHRTGLCPTWSRQVPG